MWRSIAAAPASVSCASSFNDCNSLASGSSIAVSMTSSRPHCSLAERMSCIVESLIWWKCTLIPWREAVSPLSEPFTTCAEAALPFGAA